MIKTLLGIPLLISSIVGGGSSTILLTTENLSFVNDATSEEDIAASRYLPELFSETDGLAAGNSACYSFFKNVDVIKDDISRIMSDIVCNGADPKIIIDYVASKRQSIDFETGVLLFFNESSEEEMIAFLDIILSSKIDIFCGWYKRILCLTAESAYVELRLFSRDVLSLYQERFDKVSI